MGAVDHQAAHAVRVAEVDADLLLLQDLGTVGGIVCSTICAVEDHRPPHRAAAGPPGRRRP